MCKVLIRPLEERDAKISYIWRNDPEVWEFTGSRPNREITEEIETEWILKALSDPTSKRFAILADNIYVGNIQLTHLDTAKPQYHIFIGDKSFWGKGVAKRATYQILYFASKVLKLKTVFLEVNNLNIPAIKAYESCGFKRIEKEENSSIMSITLDTLYKPMVSIFVMVYNHAKYLQECLDGLLMQDCDFDYEICVGEDCSLDDSRAILQRYQALYPGKFNLLLHEKNVGAIKNQNMILEICEGKFIALCEGDDYWTDPNKLQKQVDLLESHPDYAATFTSVNVVLESGTYNSTNEMQHIEASRVFTGEEILKNWISHTATYLIRNNGPINLFLALNKQFEFMYGDTPLFLAAQEYGKIYGSKDVTASYRRHDGGITNQKQDDAFLLKYIQHMKKIKMAFSKKSYAKICDRTITIFYMRLFFGQRLLSRDKYYYLGKAMQHDKALFFNIIRDKIMLLKKRQS